MFVLDVVSGYRSPPNSWNKELGLVVAANYELRIAQYMAKYCVFFRFSWYHQICWLTSKSNGPSTVCSLHLALSSCSNRGKRWSPSASFCSPASTSAAKLGPCQELQTDWIEIFVDKWSWGTTCRKPLFFSTPINIRLSCVKPILGLSVLFIFKYAPKADEFHNLDLNKIACDVSNTTMIFWHNGESPQV